MRVDALIDDSVWSILFTPDGRTKGLADAETNRHGDTDDENDDENLGDDAVTRAHVGHATPAPVRLGQLGLLLPVVLAGPYLAFGLAMGLTQSHLARSDLNVLQQLVAVVHTSLNIGIEGVAPDGVILAGSGGLVERRGSEGGGIGESRLLWDRDGC